jgi:hypothetical protein
MLLRVESLRSKPASRVEGTVFHRRSKISYKRKSKGDSQIERLHGSGSVQDNGSNNRYSLSQDDRERLLTPWQNVLNVPFVRRLQTAEILGALTAQ